MADAGTYDAVMLGAGPAGLSAAYSLARSGARIAVVESMSEPGGAMRGIRRDGFSLDVGRKELYDRLPGVYEFWSALMGADFRPYERRVGSLSDGVILETSPGPKGVWRGMTGPQGARLVTSYLWNQIRPVDRRAENLAQFYSLQNGEAYFDDFVKGYSEKLLRRPASSLPAPAGVSVVMPWAVVSEYFRSGFRRSLSGESGAPGYDSVTEQTVWKHPKGGAGAITDALARGIQSAGGEIHFAATATAIETSSGRVTGIVVEQEGRQRTLPCASIVSTVSLARLLPMVKSLETGLAPSDASAAERAATILVYLYSKRGPEFSHQWLLVNDTKYRVGRVVNYGTWGAEMVPDGANALALEYFVWEDDDLWKQPDEELKKLALFEAVDNTLVRRDDVTDVEVIRLPEADAATGLNGWDVKWRREARAVVTSVTGLHDANRPGTDRATLAGLEAADAIRAGGSMDGRSLAVGTRRAVSACEDTARRVPTASVPAWPEAPWTR